MTLWLVRHAAPLCTPGLCYGATDVPSNPQATAAAAAHLAGLLPAQARVSTSPRQRCVQLARALCALRADLAWTIDPRLAEMDFGRWEGRSWDAIGRAALDAWVANFAHHRPGGGECVSELLARVGAAWHETRARGTEAVWITHAGVVRAARLLAQGRSTVQRAEDWPAEPVPFGMAEAHTP